MAIKLRKWDSAQHLKTEEDMQAYLQACIEPYRVCRRPFFLRECPNDKTKIYS